MSKSPAMEVFCESMAQAMFGRSRKDDACVFCGSTKVNREDFRDPISFREYGISHLCQICQDKTFSGGENE